MKLDWEQQSLAPPHAVMQVHFAHHWALVGAVMFHLVRYGIRRKLSSTCLASNLLTFVLLYHKPPSEKQHVSFDSNESLHSYTSPESKFSLILDLISRLLRFLPIPSFPAKPTTLISHISCRASRSSALTSSSKADNDKHNHPKMSSVRDGISLAETPTAESRKS